jgi:hypothetical protein
MQVSTVVVYHSCGAGVVPNSDCEVIDDGCNVHLACMMYESTMHIEGTSIVERSMNGTAPRWKSERRGSLAWLSSRISQPICAGCSVCASGSKSLWPVLLCLSQIRTQKYCGSRSHMDYFLHTQSGFDHSDLCAHLLALSSPLQRSSLLQWLSGACRTPKAVFCQLVSFSEKVSIL